MTVNPVRAAVASLLLAGSLMASPVFADAGWFESGDTLLRIDLQLLNDAEVIRLPINQWPLPRAAVEYALADAKEHFATNGAVAAALARTRARIQPSRASGASAIDLDVRASAGSAGLLRDFDAVAREDGELGARAGVDGERFAAALSVTAVTDASDGQSLRADGSHATLALGNWLVSAHTLERWWGPSHESSLILSSNARPMPTLMVERAAAIPFETPWLSWLGPWRMSFGVSRMEGERADIDAPLFLAWRVTVMPFKDIELGLSRTAQFCGKQLECNFKVFGNLLVGNDNVGIDATAENEPGNQMAGFDIRWNSPIGNWPYAIYSQMIGEDESSYLPAKYLAQFGAEAWKPLAGGALVQTFAEYSTTTCSANTGRGPYYNCSYHQGRFNVEGYRYEGRVIGYTTDSDAESYTLGALYTTPSGDVWTATARDVVLNRSGRDVLNTVSRVAAKYNALEFGWKGSLFDQQISIDLGVESIEPRGGERDVEPFGFLGWRHQFDR